MRDLILKELDNACMHCIGYNWSQTDTAKALKKEGTKLEQALIDSPIGTSESNAAFAACQAFGKRERAAFKEWLRSLDDSHLLDVYRQLYENVTEENVRSQYD